MKSNNPYYIPVPANTYESPNFTAPAKMTVGRSQGSYPHIIWWQENDGSYRHGQVWSLAPKGEWDSSGYWVIPLGGKNEPVHVTKSNGRFHRV
jgi:hypothetical protein